MFYRLSGTNLNWNSVNTWVTSSDPYNVSTWGTSSQIPTVDDDVFLEGKIVRIDSTSINSVKARTIQNLALTPNQALNGTTPHIYPGIKVSASAGSGYVTVFTSSTTINITASTIYSGTGTITTGTLTMGIGASPVSTSINVSGNVDTTFGQTNSNGIYSSASVNWNINGNIINNSQFQNAQGIQLYTTAHSGRTFILTGSIIQNNSMQTPSSYPLYFNSTQTMNIFISGNITNNSFTSNAILMFNAHNATASITGSIYQLNRGAAIYVTTNTSTSINIKGDIYASTGYAGGVYPTIYFSDPANAVLINVNGNLYDSPAYASTVIGGATPKIRLFHSGSRTINTTEFQQVQLNPPGTILSPGSGLPITASVRSGSKYGSSLEYSGSMIVPNAKDVRYLTLVDTGSGLCFVPSTSSVRYGISSSQDTGSIRMPLSSDVLTGIIFNTGSVGTYASVDQYWNTSSAVVSQIDSIGYVLSSSLNVPFGSITGSIMSDLSNPNTPSNTVKRMQNIATTSSIIYQFSSSTN